MALPRLFDCSKKTKFIFKLRLSRLWDIGDGKYLEKDRTEISPSINTIDDLNELNKYIVNVLSIKDSQAPHAALEISIKGKIEKYWHDKTFDSLQEYSNFLSTIGVDSANFHDFLEKEKNLLTIVETEVPGIYKVKETKKSLSLASSTQY